MTRLTGGCLCGKVRYATVGEPAFSGLCHCRNCQRFTGSAFEALMAFPASAVEIEGELATYEDRGESGGVIYRRFCQHCGSGVAAEPQALGGVTAILAGTLDDPAAFNPTIELFWSRAQRWLIETGPERAKFAAMPE